MNTTFYCFLFLFLGFGLSGIARTGPCHEFHISKCQIDYNLEEQAVQMSLHLFIDDLEEALRGEGADKLFLCTEKEKKGADQHLYDYLKKHFRLTINQEERSYNFIGKESSEDLQGVWIYLEIPGINTIEQLTISNRLLLDLFEDQKNITSISVPPGKQHYFILAKGKSQESLNYNNE